MGSNAPGFRNLLQPLFHEAKVMASHCVVEAQGSCPLCVVKKKQVCCQRWPKTDRCRHFCWVSLDPSYDIYRTLRLALDTSLIRQKCEARGERLDFAD